MADYPKLTVLFEKLRGKTFELNKEQMSIGRRDGNDICIKEPSLSGHHADIIRTERDGKPVYILRDNDSTNGTRINNVPITEQELKNSDIILFGGVEVLYDNGEDADDTLNLTHTIDLSNIDSNISTVEPMINFSPFADREKEKHAKVQKLIFTVVALAVLAVIGFGVYLFILMSNM